jgi:hypothetical protein
VDEGREGEREGGGEKKGVVGRQTLSPGSSTGVAMLSRGAPFSWANICLCMSMMRRLPGSARLGKCEFARVRKPVNIEYILVRIHSIKRTHSSKRNHSRQRPEACQDQT